MMKRAAPLYLCLIWLLAACSSTQPAADAPSPAPTAEAAVQSTSTAVATTAAVATAMPTNTPAATAAVTAIVTTTPPPSPTATPTTAAAQIVSGRTDEGVFFLGDPNAPVTMIDYSDFL